MNFLRIQPRKGNLIKPQATARPSLSHQATRRSAKRNFRQLNTLKRALPRRGIASGAEPGARGAARGEGIAGAAVVARGCRNPSLRGLPLNRRQWITHQSNNLVSSKPNEGGAPNPPGGVHKV